MKNEKRTVEDKSIPKLINFPPQLIKEIEEHQAKNSHLTTFTAAVLDLLVKGLNKKDTQ